MLEIHVRFCWCSCYKLCFFYFPLLLNSFALTSHYFWWKEGGKKNIRNCLFCGILADLSIIKTSVKRDLSVLRNVMTCLCFPWTISHFPLLFWTSYEKKNHQPVDLWRFDCVIAHIRTTCCFAMRVIGASTWSAVNHQWPNHPKVSIK